MRIIMTKSRRGSEDGITVRLYAEGQAYDLGEALAQSFIGSKCARHAPDSIDQTDGSIKKAKGPDKNK